MNKQKLILELCEKSKKLFGNKLERIILYGSYARDQQSAESDIDFILLVDDTIENLTSSRYKIAEMMSSLSLSFNILVSITEETYAGFFEYAKILPFYKNIQEQGVDVYAK